MHCSTAPPPVFEESGRIARAAFGWSGRPSPPLHSDPDHPAAPDPIPDSAILKRRRAIFLLESRPTGTVLGRLRPPGGVSYRIPARFDPYQVIRDPVAEFCIGKRTRQRQCSGSSASEVEFSKGYRHFASVITLAECGITVKVEASLRKRAPPRRHSAPPGRREPHWGRKPTIGVGRALAARERREALGQETTYWSRLLTCPNAPLHTPMLARVRPLRDHCGDVPRPAPD